MSLGIFSHRAKPHLGYFAPPAQRARMDLGPEIPGVTSPADYESRQQFERGLNAMLAMARQRPGPGLPGAPGTDPALREYQEAVQWLSLRDPSRAAELAQTAGQVGIMAQRRRARPLLFGRPPTAGLGYIQVPGLGPGSSLVDVAYAGTPVRLLPPSRRGWSPL